MNNLFVDRYELKYMISHQQYHLLKALLSAVLSVDEHAQENNSYYIRSLYFDSPENMDFYSKDDGLYGRKKIRLRLYDYSEEVIKLEVKNKYGSTMRKETSFISKEHATCVSSGNYECLLDYNQAVTTHIYRTLKTTNALPKVVIDYEREAYVCKSQNIRINFDKNIRACSTQLDLFDPALAMVPLSVGDFLVLEVKYTSYLPDFIRTILSSCPMTRTSYSKYCIARENV